MLEITFSKNGEQYVSNPIFASGVSVVSYQIGYKKAGARLLVETSFSPTDGWKLVVDQVAPAMDDMCVGTQLVPKGAYVRFRTNTIPDKVLVNIGSDGNSGSAESSEIVETLPSSGEEGRMYHVKNNKGIENNEYDEYVFLNGKYEKIGEEHELADDNDIDKLFG